MDVRQRLLQLAEEAGVVLEVDVRVLAVDGVDLREAVDRMLLDRVLDELLGGQREGILLLARLREGAELALHPADIRLVQVHVLDEIDLVAAPGGALGAAVFLPRVAGLAGDACSNALPAREVGELAQRKQIVGLHQRDPVVEIEPLAGEHFLPDRGERVESVQNGHRGLTFPGLRLRVSGPRARLCATRRRVAPWLV
jgi:hypothetical protein